MDYDSEVSNVSDARKASGQFTFYDPELGTQTFHSARCVHCGRQWQVIKGSGRRRGFCLKCMGILCGDTYCLSDCNPFEARLEYSEAVGNNNQKKISSLEGRYPNIKVL